LISDAHCEAQQKSVRTTARRAETQLPIPPALATRGAPRRIRPMLATRLAEEKQALVRIQSLPLQINADAVCLGQTQFQRVKT